MTNRPTTVNIYDTSGFDQDARMLALYYLQPIRDTGSLQPGSAGAKTVSDMLEAILEVPVFESLLYYSDYGSAIAEIDNHTLYSGIVSSILNSMGTVRTNILRAAPQIPQGTENPLNSRIPQVPDSVLQIDNSPNLDILTDLPDCNDLRVDCIESDFSDNQKLEINARIDLLMQSLRASNYSTTDAAMLAVHESRFYDLAKEIGIEFFVTITKYSRWIHNKGRRN